MWQIIDNFYRVAAMDECCLRAHAKLISGTCPWCGRSVQNGQVVDLVNTLRELLQVPGRRPTTLTSVQSVVLNQGPLEPIVAVQYIQIVATQLNAHFSAAPHRDISPANMFITSTGAAIVGPPYVREEDSGLALEIRDEDPLIVADYLAPEQALNSQKADCRSDIYSLGCTLFFMLTGQPPFKGISISEVLLKHQTEPPPLAYKINPNVPQPLAIICQKMMAKKQTDRYQTWMELQTALAIWLDE